MFQRFNKYPGGFGSPNDAIQILSTAMVTISTANSWTPSNLLALAAYDLLREENFRYLLVKSSDMEEIENKGGAVMKKLDPKALLICTENKALESGWFVIAYVEPMKQFSNEFHKGFIIKSGTYVALTISKQKDGSAFVRLASSPYGVPLKPSIAAGPMLKWGLGLFEALDAGIAKVIPGDKDQGTPNIVSCQRIIL